MARAFRGDRYRSKSDATSWRSRPSVGSPTNLFTDRSRPSRIIDRSQPLQSTKEGLVERRDERLTKVQVGICATRDSAETRKRHATKSTAFRAWIRLARERGG